MRSVLKGIFTLIICFAAVHSCEAAEVRYPSAKGFVNDTAGVLSAAAKAQLEGLLQEIERKTTAEVVLVTVKTTAPLTIEQYAVGLFQKWGIGKKASDNGLLLLMATGDRRVRIEVGYGLEGAVTDLQSKIIIEDLMIPAFKKGGYDLGLSSGLIMIAKLISDEYGVKIDLKGNLATIPVSRGRKRSPLGSLLTFVFFILIFGFRFGALFFLMGSGRGGYWSGGGRSSFGGGFGGFGGGMSGGGGASGSW